LKYDPSRADVSAAIFQPLDGKTLQGSYISMKIHVLRYIFVDGLTWMDEILRKIV
jgi:hypothetical protein